VYLDVHGVGDACSRQFDTDDVAFLVVERNSSLYRPLRVGRASAQRSHFGEIQLDRGTAVQRIRGLAETNSIRQERGREVDVAITGGELRTNRHPQKKGVHVVRRRVRLCDLNPRRSLVQPIQPIQRLGEIAGSARKMAEHFRAFEFLADPTEGAFGRTGVGVEEVEIPEDFGAPRRDRSLLTELFEGDARRVDELLPGLELPLLVDQPA